MKDVILRAIGECRDRLEHGSAGAPNEVFTTITFRLPGRG